MAYAIVTILAIHATNLFPFIAFYAGVRIGTVTLVLLAATLLYLFVERRLVADLLRYRVVLWWLALMLVWPALTAVYTVGDDLAREIGVRTNIAALVLCGAVLVRRGKLGLLSRALLACLVVLSISIVYSLFRPLAFVDVIALIDERVPITIGRGYGFALQPNVAGDAVAFLTLLSLYAVTRRNQLWNAVISAVALIAVVATGSRAGLAGVVLVVFGAPIVDVLASRGADRAFAVRRLTFGFSIMVVISIGVGVLLLSDRIQGSDAFGIVSARMGDLIHPQQVIVGDESLAARAEAESRFRGFIADKPILGYGLNSSMSMVRSQYVDFVSHNRFVGLAFEFGIPYVLALLIVLAVGVWIAAHTPDDGTALRLALPTTALFLLLGLASPTIMECRPFAIVLGAMLGAIAQPAYRVALMPFSETAHGGEESGRRDGLPEPRFDS